MTAKEYRAIAREKLAGNWKIAILAGLIALYLGGLMASSNVNININLDEDTQFQISSILLYPITALGLGGILSIVQFIIGGVIRQGYCLFLLKQHDGEALDFKDLFSQMHNFGAGFCLKFLEGLYIVLWTLLLIVPGIIATYKYAMAPFILLENPDMTASEAITASKYLMDGHKWELFCLDFSFFGWNLLSVLTLGVGSLALNPYMNAARAAFYRNLRPNVQPEFPVELPAAEPQA